MGRYSKSRPGKARLSASSASRASASRACSTSSERAWERSASRISKDAVSPTAAASRTCRSWIWCVPTVASRMGTTAVVADKVRFGLHEVGLDPDEHAPYVMHLLGVGEAPSHLSPELSRPVWPRRYAPGASEEASSGRSDLRRGGPPLGRRLLGGVSRVAGREPGWRADPAGLHLAAPVTVHRGGSTRT